jgi:glycosyltransferase involved in cell wall biosynthesis
VPFFDAARFLGEAIESVCNQSFVDWELLLVDDGGRDASAAIAQEHAARDPRIRVLMHPSRGNRGAAASRNLGVGAARGDYVAFLDADDVWLPEKLERQVALLRSHPSAGMVYGAPLYWHGWTGRAADARRDHTPPLPVAADTLARAPELLTISYPLGWGSAPCPSDLMIRRDLVLEVGGFEESFVGALQLYEDQTLLAKLYLRADVFVSGERWLRYRQHDDSCVATVTGAGRYDRVRLHFLEWLEGYVGSVAAPATVHDAIRRELWWQQRPVLRDLRRRIRRLRGRSG